MIQCQNAKTIFYITTFWYNNLVLIIEHLPKYILSQVANEKNESNRKNVNLNEDTDVTKPKLLLATGKQTNI